MKANLNEGPVASKLQLAVNQSLGRLRSPASLERLFHCEGDLLLVAILNRPADRLRSASILLLTTARQILAHVRAEPLKMVFSGNHRDGLLAGEPEF